MHRGAALAIVVVVSAGALLPWATWWRARALRTTPRPLDVALVTLDTTRADRLGCYGDLRAQTPRRPDSSPMRFRRAQLLEEMGRVGEARADCEAVAPREPGARDALARLAAKDR